MTTMPLVEEPRSALMKLTHSKASAGNPFLASQAPVRVLNMLAAGAAGSLHYLRSRLARR